MANDKLNINSLDNWKKGDSLAAKHLDQPVKVLQSLALPKIPQQISSPTIKYEVRMFKVVRLEKDVIICVDYDGENEGEDEIVVAMPPLCRQTPFDSELNPDAPLRRGKKYTYTFTDDDTGLPRYDKRTSIDTENDDDEEIQVITPYYVEGDMIYAASGTIKGTGVFPESSQETQVLWRDVNDDGRAYALSTEDEPEEE